MTPETIRTWLTVKHLAIRYGVSVPTIWRWARETDFPKPVKLGPSATRWKLSDLEAWEAEREVMA